MNSIFNYLRGDEYFDQQNQQSQTITNIHKLKENVQTFKQFLKYLSKIFKLLFPKFLCASTFLFIFLIIDIILLELIVYRVGLFGGKYYKVLSNKDLDAFWPLAITSIAYIVVNAVMKSIKDFISNLLSIVWRKYITIKLHDLYFENKNFYFLQQRYQSNLNNDFNFNSDSSENEINNPHIKSNLIRIEVSANNKRKSLNNTNSNQEPILNDIQPIPTTIQNKYLNKTVLDNPDQRITQDVNSLCASIATIIPLILISPFVIAWYGYQTYKTVGYSGPLVVFIYFIFWSLINGPLTRPIARVIYKQDKKEGDFRFRHMNLRVNAESIAFYDSSKYELNKINDEFNNLLNISYRRNWKELILKIFVNISQYMGGIIAYLVLAIPIFTHVYDDFNQSDLAQLISNYSFKCQYLIYLFTRLYDILDEISVIGGNTHRVGELFEKMTLNNSHEKKNKKFTNNKNSIRPSSSVDKENESSNTNEVKQDKTCFLFDNLTIRVPELNGKVLIKQLNFEFKQNENVLISGRSGCGKTSLFRCINGLWNSFTGHIHIKNNDLFFLPQKSYFTSGSLLEQIIYPSFKLDNQLNNLEFQNNIIEWLNAFNLSHLIEKVNHSLDSKPEFNWSTMLSAGEQQRLAFLRVIYHKPKFVLLDEFSSSVDQEIETLMYEYLNKIGCTYMSIAHRDTVRKYHQVELKFLNNQSYEIINLVSI